MSRKPSRTAVSPRAETAAVAIPHDPQLPERARALWESARWEALRDVGDDGLAHHPERALVAGFRAAAAAGLGDRQLAGSLARQAIEWGLDRGQLATLLLSAAHDTLGRAHLAAGRDAQALASFTRAFGRARMSSQTRRLAQARHDEVDATVRAALAADRERHAGGHRGLVAGTPQWLVQLSRDCLAAPDLLERADAMLHHELNLADDRLQFLLLMASGMTEAGDKPTAIRFLQRAVQEADEATPEGRQRLVQHLMEAGTPGLALDLVVAEQLKDATGALGQRTAATLRAEFERLRDSATTARQHGHELLLHHLSLHVARLRKLAAPRQLVLIEIGTTREEMASQGSTRKIARFCMDHAIHFITVDMDPYNSQVARELFASMGCPFEAVTMKGEDYLAQRSGPIDLVFLDAYDFDHGQHSALRQSRYERFLGSRIDEQACHRMHLECAESVAAKLWAHGLVCVDDTWREGGGWTAKGTLAVPYLLDHGFRLLDERNRAVLLDRAPADG